MRRLCFMSIVGIAAGLTVIGSSAWGAVVPKDVAELTVEANKIVIGDVVEVTSFWTADQPMIKTRVAVRVDDYLKLVAAPAPGGEPMARPALPRGIAPAGDDANREVLVLDGGTVDDVTLTVTVLPRFELGDRVLLFLDDHETRLVGGFQGAYLTDGALATVLYPGCARARSDGYRPLADLLLDIADALPPEQATRADIDAITPYEGDFTLPLPAPRYALCGYDWTYQANPMGESYVVNGNCTDGAAGSSAQQVAEINKGTNAWNNAGADFSFNYGGTSGGTSVTYNGVNLVFFSNNPPAGGGYVAATFIWQSGGNISECDLVFNDGDYSWWNGQGGCSGQFDIWNVATHEFGHFLCLADLYGGGDSAKTMYGYVSYCDTHARTLHSDDINGIISIYGVGGPSCGDGSCNGNEDRCSCPSDCGNPPGSESNCTDGQDNDCDGNTDCDDDDCDTDPACAPYCGDGTCDPGEDKCSCPSDCGNPPGSENNCTDGIDNDCDGLTDAADVVDCGAPGCVCGDINDSGGPVDLADFVVFAGCFNGDPASSQECWCSDMNGDQTIDLADFVIFAGLFGGSSTNTPPNCP